MKLVAMPPLRGGVLIDVRVQVSLLVRKDIFNKCYSYILIKK